MLLAPFARALLVPLAALAFASGAARAQNDVTLYTHDAQGLLATVDVSNGQVTMIGDLGTVMTDIAFDQDGRLYGLDFTTVYEINPVTAEIAPIGNHGIPNGNALVFGADRTLYAAGGTSTQLYEIDPSTGAATALGNVNFFSAGDLAFVGPDLYLATSAHTLARIDFGPGPTGVGIGAFGFFDVFGLATSTDGVLYGISGTEIFAADPLTGAGLLTSDYSGQGLDVAFGSSFFGEAAQACPPAPVAGCREITKAKLGFKGKKAGSEKLTLSMKKFGDATQPSDYGDPVEGETRFEVCLYTPAGDLAGGLGVARSGDLCGPKQKPCWKAKGDKGWLYKNPDGAPSGVRKMLLGAGPAGKGKLIVKAGNKARKLQTGLPGGIGPALAGETAVHVQVTASNAACYEALIPTQKADPRLLKAKTTKK